MPNPVLRCPPAISFVKPAIDAAVGGRPEFVRLHLLEAEARACRIQAVGEQGEELVSYLLVVTPS